jgi:glutamate racemase
MIPTRPSQRPIAVFDSGIGGLPYLSAARACLPGESFIYIADRAGFPYGTKSRETLRDIVIKLVSQIVRSHAPKAIIIACNTASQVALEAVRKANPGLAIIGTVPAVKPAAERTRSGVIGVMATAGALEDPYLDILVARHAKGIHVLRESAQELVSFVERRSAFAGEEERHEAVAPYVRHLVDQGADEIVLACTHFLHLRDDITAFAGPTVEVIDSRAGVVKRLRQQLSEKGLLETNMDSLASPGSFVLTGDEPFEAEYGLLAETFGLANPEPVQR